MKQKLLYIISLIAFFFSSVVYSQSNSRGSIKGFVVDGTTGETISYVTIAVKSLESSEIVSGQITDDKGQFIIQQIPIGDYIIEIQFLGYQNLSNELTISKENNQIDLGQITIYDAVQDLGTVEITAERSTIQQKIDRKVINIGKDLATTGPSAADLMVNLPSVDVDQNGTVSLRGNDNVLILVDGKPSNLSTSQLLQQIPSGSIKQIELITNPSAKYVPEGMSGIINIVLKKNTNLGFNGNATGGLTAGREQRWNGSIDTNYKTGKANYYINYGLTDGPSPTWGTVTRSGDSSDEIWLAINDRSSHLLKLGVDYDLSSKTILSAFTVQNAFRNNAFRSTDVRFLETQSNDFGQDYTSEMDNYSYTYNFDLRHKFSSNSSIEFELDHSQLDGNEVAEFNFYGSTVLAETARENITTLRDNTIFNLDYELEIGETKKLELGAEARVQKTHNSYNTTNENFNGGSYDFDRNIYAAYFNFSNELGKWSYQIGARFEDFETIGIFREEGRAVQQFDDQIFSIYPSFFLSYIPDPKTQRDAFNFSISRRVDRPNLDQVNPMRAWSSARITNVGNPALVPQFTSSLEGNYTRQFKKGSITSGVFYRQIQDEITRFGFTDPVNPENILFSYSNYQDNSAYGFELSGNHQLTPWWSVTSSFDVYSQLQRGVAQDEFREVRSVLYNFRMNHSLKGSKRLTFQLIGLYRGGNTNLQYRTLAFYFINAGARYSMFQGKGTLSLNFNDIFRTQQFSFEGERPVVQSGSFDWDSQTVFLGYTHRFGNGKKQALKRKRRDSNEKKNSGGL